MQTNIISESQPKEKGKKALHTILEAIGYGFFGTVFIIFCDFVTRPTCPPMFSCDTLKRGIPPGGVLIGAVISVLLVNFLFGKIIKSEFVRWSLILVITSITSILIQTVFIISRSHFTFEEILSIYSGNELMEEILNTYTIMKSNEIR